MSLTGLSSLHDWAGYLAGLIGDTIPKPAIWKRVNKNLLPCLKSILTKAFQSQKVYSFIKKNKDRIISSIDWKQFEKEICYYTAYEKRKKDGTFWNYI
jgi:hypothetical protein